MPFHLAIRSRIIDVRKKSRTYHLAPKISRQRRLGFTLIELLIAIAIVGILSTIGFYAFTSSQKRARDTQRKNDLTQVKKAMEAAKNDCRAGLFYPDPDSDTAVDDFVELSTYLSDTDINYMQNTTSDPQNTSPYVYSFHKPAANFTNVCNDSAGGRTQEGVKTFVLRAKLEIGKDPDTNKSRTSCSVLFGTGVDQVNISPTADDGYFYVCPD